MVKDIFETIQNSKGLTGIQCEACNNGITPAKQENQKLVVIAWRSPYASLKRNQQLDRDLRKIYKKYYFRVLLDSMGLFW